VSIINININIIIQEKGENSDGQFPGKKRDISREVFVYNTYILNARMYGSVSILPSNNSDNIIYDR
jgi:hypothetical protein